jgi:2-iminoacetate synthase
MPIIGTESGWIKNRIQHGQIEKYMKNGKIFLDDAQLRGTLQSNKNPDPRYIKDILEKSLAIQNLSLEETAALLHVDDPDLLAAMQRTALAVKRKVYDNRVVTFAPLYLGNYCVNNCLYCGFKKDNHDAQRKVLDHQEIRDEVTSLAGEIGHKRLIVVYGEHPRNDIDYIIDSIQTIYDVKVKVRQGEGNIRRVNVNAPPFSIEDLRKLKEVGIGTYQVFQETYHRPTYEKVHPASTIKGNYLWRLYAMHRAFEAGIDDVGLGVLFGLYDWRYEVMALVQHSIELEKVFGIGPHTVSFPRLEPALNAKMEVFQQYQVPDQDFKKILMVLRLAVPFTGMIITARESVQMRNESLDYGITQMDASTQIGLGGYHLKAGRQEQDKQQFLLGDQRSLDALIRELCAHGMITSFCTAGYRCGRTGKCIMDLLRKGEEGKFCKLNAILTFQEWLEDFASEDTKKIADPVVAREIQEVQAQNPRLFPQFERYYERIKAGERDLYI